MNKVEKIQCEQLCLVGQAGVMPYGVYVYNEDKTKINTAAGYHNGEEAKIVVETMNDGKPSLLNRAVEVLDFGNMLEELEFDDVKGIFKERLGEKAYSHFFSTILAPSLGVGIETDVLAKASEQLVNLQEKKMIKEETPEM